MTNSTAVRYPPPSEVAGNADAAAYWTTYTASVTRGGLSATDLPLLARLCMALAYADDASRRIGATGLLVQAPGSALPAPNPYLAVLDQQTAIAARLSAILEPRFRGW